MVRVLLVIAIGLPIAIEVVTFGGLIGHYLDGGGAGPAATPTADGQTTVVTPTADGQAATPTPGTAEGVSVGDEILPATAATERIDGVTVTDGDDATTLTLTVGVSDPPDGYELRLGSVTTQSGATVAGNASATGALAADETGSVTGTWQLPAGDRPDTLAVTVVSNPGDATPTTQAYTIDLGDLSD